MKNLLAILPFVLTTSLTNGQHVLKNFTGNSDFGLSDISVQNSCSSGSLKTKGKITFETSVNTIETITISCARNVTFSAPATYTIKGKVVVKTNQLTIGGKITLIFFDNDSRLTIEYQSIDETGSPSREFLLSKFNYAQLNLVKKDLTCD